MSGVPFPVGLFTLLANHHGISQPSVTVLGACFLLMVPFRTRFSPCEMARTANVQRLIGRLYTLRYYYIPICRFPRHRSASAWLLVRKVFRHLALYWSTYLS